MSEPLGLALFLGTSNRASKFLSVRGFPLAGKKTRIIGRISPLRVIHYPLCGSSTNGIIPRLLQIRIGSCTKLMMSIPLEFRTLPKPQYRSSTLGSWLGDKANDIWKYVGSFLEMIRNRRSSCGTRTLARTSAILSIVPGHRSHTLHRKKQRKPSKEDKGCTKT